MPSFSLSDEGILVGEDGEPVRIGDNQEPVKVANARTQTQVDQAVKDRLARQAERVKTLEQQANRTPELEKLFEAEQIEKHRLEEELVRVRETAQQEHQMQLTKLQKQTGELDAALKAERLARTRDQVSTVILGQARDVFNDPALDVVPHLLAAHKREPKVGQDGKPLEGEFVDLFRMSWTGEDDKPVVDYVPVDRALQLWAASHPHHVRPSVSGGSGGGQYGPVPTNLNRSRMTTAQKAAFLEKHSLEDYRRLPE